MKTSCFSLKRVKKKKRSRSNDFGSDEYSYSILYSDPRVSEYSDTRSSPNPHDVFLLRETILNVCQTGSQTNNVLRAKVTIFQ